MLEISETMEATTMQKMLEKRCSRKLSMEETGRSEKDAGF
jgi:hypothetical protein